MQDHCPTEFVVAWHPTPPPPHPTTTENATPLDHRHFGTSATAICAAFDGVIWALRSCRACPVRGAGNLQRSLIRRTCWYEFRASCINVSNNASRTAHFNVNAGHKHQLIQRQRWSCVARIVLCLVFLCIVQDAAPSF